MYAIVATGGKQYKVSPGEKVKVEKLEGSVGDKVVLDSVLFLSESKAVGTPYIEGASVETEITKQGKSKKVIVYKYKPKSGYHKKNGHRQLFTELSIISISKDGEILAEIEAEEETAAEETTEEAAAEEITEEEVSEEAAEEVVTEEVSEEVSEEVTVEEVSLDEVPEETEEA